MSQTCQCFNKCASIDQALTSMGLLDKPFALFGHSFGSLVMFELARKLTEAVGKTPLCLIVSGCRPPDVSYLLGCA